MWENTTVSNVTGHNESTLSNVTINTAHFLYESRELIDRICTPIIYVIGFPGNTLSLIIWMQKRMRHSSGYYLAALAFNDLLFLSLQVLYELEVAWHHRVLAYPVICEIFPTVYLTTQCLSPFLVLAFTTERYISICHPFKREKYCTVTRAKFVILVLAVIGLAVNCVNSYFFVLNDDGVCGPRPEVMVGGVESVFSVFSTCADFMYYFVVPLAILILNIQVIREMRRLSCLEQAQQYGTQNKTGSTTVMLLAVSFYQILTTVPISVVCVLLFIYRDNPRFDLAKTIIYEYGYTHYAFNIFIYLITGKMFRRELKKLVLRPFGKLSSGMPREYSTLRTSISTSPPTKSMWVSTNGNHGVQDKNNGDAGETLL